MLHPKWRFHFIHLSRHAKFSIRWAFINVAFVVFFCDVIAQFIPGFNKVWDNVSHLAVGSAVLLSQLAEYLIKEDEVKNIKETEK